MNGMTDITELAQSLKRRAASANEFGESHEDED